jgi:hypothetical protein
VVVDTTLPSPSLGDDLSVSAIDVRLVTGRVAIVDQVATLAGKLGVTPERRTLAVGPVPDAVRDQLGGADHHPSPEPYDVVVAFNADRAMLDRHVSKLPARLSIAGGLWLCWPKKSSGVVTDIGEADVRAAGLEVGLVDNKIAAIDETWSGLRFVRRLTDRPLTAIAGPGRRQSPR